MILMVMPNCAWIKLLRESELTSYFFMKVLILRVSRDFGLRARIEPSSLAWADAKITAIDNQNIEFHGLKKVSLHNLLRKGDNLYLKNPKKKCLLQIRLKILMTHFVL